MGPCHMLARNYMEYYHHEKYNLHYAWWLLLPVKWLNVWGFGFRIQFCSLRMVTLETLPIQYQVMNSNFRKPKTQTEIDRKSNNKINHWISVHCVVIVVDGWFLLDTIGE